MIKYYAQKENTAVYVTEIYQMDHYLEKGWRIYQEDGKEKELIATPDKGYLYGKPDIKNISELEIENEIQLRADVDFLLMLTDEN